MAADCRESVIIFFLTVFQCWQRPFPLTTTLLAFFNAMQRDLVFSVMCHFGLHVEIKQKPRTSGSKQRPTTPSCEVKVSTRETTRLCWVIGYKCEVMLFMSGCFTVKIIEKRQINMSSGRTEIFPSSLLNRLFVKVEAVERRGINNNDNEV